MQITRCNHVRYMTKITPFLVFLYFAQMLLYQKFAPADMTGDINVFLGIGLAFIILCFSFYDHHHKIIAQENYMEVSFALLKIKEEILYRNIIYAEITKKKNSYGKITLHLHDGSVCHLYHVDSPELLLDFIEKKKIKKAGQKV
jgi:hypothetical protein